MRRLALATGIVLAWLAGPVRAQTVPNGFTVETLAPGLAFPTAIEFLPDGRVLYVEQFTGRVRVFTVGVGVQATPVLTVPGITAGGERGLLGLAVDPSFPLRPYLYLYYDVAVPNHIRIARYTLSGNLDGTSVADLVADPASRFDLIDDIPDQAENHNGGTLRFGLERLLYASVGEDGVPCGAQDSTSLRGVILRLNTSELPPGPGRASRAQLAPADNPFAASPDSNERLVAALGLRNPFRFQVDFATGQLVIGDVGENVREEIDYLSPGTIVVSSRPFSTGPSPFGADFGWPYLEGTLPGAHRNECGPIPPNLTAPIFEYDRTQQPAGAAVVSAGLMRTTGGNVRGFPTDYEENIFASDYYNGDLRRLTSLTGTWQIADPVPGQSTGSWGTGFGVISDWRLGPDGALWFCRQASSLAETPNTGSIGRIAGPGTVSAPPAPLAFELELARTPAVGAVVMRVAAPGDVRLRVFDAGGRLVKTLHDGTLGQPPGSVVPIIWDARDDDGRAIRAGVYLVSLEAAGRRLTRRIVFLR
jgi:glucose/arabinose dehydrogenase